MPKEAEGDPVGDGGGGNGVEKGFKGGASTADATVSEHTRTGTRTGVDNGGGNGGNGVEKGFKGGATAADATVDEHSSISGDGGGGPGEPAMGKDYNSTRHNTSSINVEDDLVGDGGGPGEPAMRRSAGYYGSSKSNTSSINVEDDLVGDGGGPGEPAMRRSAGYYGSSKSNTSEVDGGGFEADTAGATLTNRLATGGGGGGKGPGIVRKGVGKTLGLAKTMIMTAVLISVAGAGVDVYQTYNDAIAIDLEEHITDADFEMSDDKSEISGTVGFDIPQMGTFEKSIIASVHVTILESSPTTDGDYEFEYTLGSGEQFYAFTLDDLDPVTVETIEAGEPLDIEYSGTISVTYLGIEIPSITMDIPLTTTSVETA
jgi:hypothetical protein